MDEMKVCFQYFCYRHYCSMAFTTDRIPESWNVEPMHIYHTLIKSCDEKSVSVVFFDESDQLIETILSYEDFNTKRIWLFGMEHQKHDEFQNPRIFEELMYAIYGYNWRAYIKWRTAASSESFADLVNKYLELHKLSPSQIPPHDLTMMVNEWWDEFILGGIKHENDCESVENDS